MTVQVFKRADTVTMDANATIRGSDGVSSTTWGVTGVDAGQRIMRL